MEKYITIREAAERLKVDPSTIRRRIKNGEYKAKKEPGPYGPQYLIPFDQIPDPQAQVVHEVTTVTRSISPAELQSLMEQAVTAATRQAVSEAVAPISEEVRQLRAELEAHNRKVDEQLRAAINQVPKSFWQKLFGG